VRSLAAAGGGFGLGTKRQVFRVEWKMPVHIMLVKTTCRTLLRKTICRSLLRKMTCRLLKGGMTRMVPKL
jgi:hypothetical protein